MEQRRAARAVAALTNRSHGAHHLARALAKARGTVEDFARSYMPLLGLPVDDVLCFADSLYFVAGFAV